MRFLSRRALVLQLALTTAIFSSCGYQIGGTRPSSLSKVKTLHIAMPENETLVPSLEADLKNHLVDQALLEGSYKIVRSGNVDAVLSTTLKSLRYDKIRTARTDALRPEELSMKMIVDWSVQDAGNTLLNGSTVTSTRFFLDPNLQISQDNAYPDALSRVALRIIQNISDTY